MICYNYFFLTSPKFQQWSLPVLKQNEGNFRDFKTYCTGGTLIEYDDTVDNFWCTG